MHNVEGPWGPSHHFRGLRPNKGLGDMTPDYMAGLLVGETQHLQAEVREEWGARAIGSDRIVVVPKEGLGLIRATRRRTVISWIVDGEPNDNWPKYIGPWTEVK